MATLISLPNGKCDLKFGSKAKNFKRVEKFNYRKNFFKVYIDKNDSVYDIKRCVVVSWRKGKGKANVPDEITETRDTYWFNRIKGNQFKTAITKIAAEIDAQLLV